MTFVVRLSGPTSVPVTVSYSTMPVGGDPATEGGACGAGVDYIRSAGTLTFQPGEVEKRIGVAVCDDVFLEGETLAVNLTGATNATISDAHAIGTINDDSKDAVPEP